VDDGSVGCYDDRSDLVITWAPSLFGWNDCVLSCAEYGQEPNQTKRSAPTTSMEIVFVIYFCSVVETQQPALIRLTRKEI